MSFKLFSQPSPAQPNPILIKYFAMGLWICSCQKKVLSTIFETDHYFFARKKGYHHNAAYTSNKNFYCNMIIKEEANLLVGNALLPFLSRYYYLGISSKIHLRFIFQILNLELQLKKKRMAMNFLQKIVFTNILKNFDSMLIISS